MVSNDDVTFDATSAAGAFADATVDTGKTVIVTGITISGADAGNYALTQPAPTASITPVTVTPSVTVAGKPYDGTTAATITASSLSGVIGSDDVNLGTSGTAAFTDKNVGTGKTVNVTGLSLSGTTAGNYVLSATTASTTADITALTITVTAASDSKPYDGTTASAGVPAITAGALASGDTAAWTQTFDNKNAGTGKTLTPAGTVSDGNGGNNYSVSFFGNSSGIIIARGLTVTGITASNKVYDGTTGAALNTGSAVLAGASQRRHRDARRQQRHRRLCRRECGHRQDGDRVRRDPRRDGSGNYSLTPPTTTADITPASSALAVSSSANPSPTGSNVTLTATVSIVAPGGGTAGGTVQFMVDGAAFGPPATLDGGVASLDSSALAHGSHTVAAEYAGNGNFQGSTNSLSPDLLVNTAPVGWNTTMSAMKNQSTNLSATKLALKCTDPDGDALSITAVDTNSAQGGTVVLSGNTITYTPPTDYTGADSFTYTVTDYLRRHRHRHGRRNRAGPQGLADDSAPHPVAGRQHGTQASGIPGETYLIQAGTNLTDWRPLAPMLLIQTG